MHAGALGVGAVLFSVWESLAVDLGQRCSIPNSTRSYFNYTICIRPSPLPLQEKPNVKASLQFPGERRALRRWDMMRVDGGGGPRARGLGVLARVVDFAGALV